MTKINSESEPGKVYEVNLIDHTCTCLHYTRKLYTLASSDPHRLCKHLVTTMANSNAFEGFEKFKDEILWFAEQKSSYSNRDKTLNKKLYPPKKSPKEKLSPGTIQTIAHEITEQPDIGGIAFYLSCDPGIYHYFKGKAKEDTMEAIIPGPAGVGIYSINGQRAREYRFGQPVSDETDILEESKGFTITLQIETEPVPRQYKHLQEALFFWLDEEFCRLSL